MGKVLILLTEWFFKKSEILTNCYWGITMSGKKEKENLKRLQQKKNTWTSLIRSEILSNCSHIKLGKKGETLNLKIYHLFKPEILSNCGHCVIISVITSEGKREKRVNLKNCLRTNLSNGLSSVSFCTQTQKDFYFSNNY